MTKKILAFSGGASIVALSFLAGFLPARPNNEVLRGWLSDEQCARGRAEGGKFTATNPDCAHKCVGEGKKVVFVDPAGKRVLTLADQIEAKKNLGNYVEITGSVDSAKETLRPDSIKFLDQARPMCEVPTKKAANP